MVCGSARSLLYLSILVFLFIFRTSKAHPQTENGLQTETFLSPKFVLEPGSVSNKYYYNIDFPKGHIGIKSFDAEVIDKKGNPIPLHETYLHHWVVVRYYQRKGVRILTQSSDQRLHQSDRIVVRNEGLCDHGIVQYFGLGSETRRTATNVPDPYGIVVGNPSDVPVGYEEVWMLNVHAIDTRGAEDKLGCTECRCDLYNVTGRLLPTNYKGGLRCCYDEARCKLKEGFRGVKRSLYLRYKVTYVDWDASILPVKIYILDVTDIWTKADDRHRCLIEYNVESCGANDSCTHTRTLTVSLPTGGDVIYGVGHQHTGGVGSTLYGEGGREICSSYPTYGSGDEPGNEAGYIVGMSTCYPSPGSLKIASGEMLTLVSNYSSSKMHTGVMGLFYLLISDSSAKPENATLLSLAGAHEITAISKLLLYGIVLFGVGLLIILVFSSKGGREEGYEAIST
ncbi:hypothetical protein CASFOL_042528 [Castilleja foliolosa]|uniref:MtN19-like protein n=1 Tax=Castilleja foliolosa TaxID=1961234 RepID=A0ABD3B8B4_9LAMI